MVIFVERLHFTVALAPEPFNQNVPVFGVGEEVVDGVAAHGLYLEPFSPRLVNSSFEQLFSDPPSSEIARGVMY